MSRCFIWRGRPNPRSLLTATSFGLAALAFAPAAPAHIRLLEPTPRYDITGGDTGIKSCPCGLGTVSNRMCNVAVDGSDPDRGTRVTRAEAGDTITLRFEEYIGHDGTYRVAFDPEGADVADFNANILVPMVADPPGNMGNVGEGTIWEIDVTLPDMICNNCTLQLIQAMNGQQTTPVVDPSGVGTYYTCVDLDLVAPGTLDDPNGADPDDMGTDDGMDGDPMPGQGMMGGAVQPTDSNNMVGGMMGSTPGTPGTSNMNGMTGTSTGDGVMNPGYGSMAGGSSGGCSLSPLRTPAASGGVALLLAGLASLLGIRRRSARAA
jgi:hypothetical protein